MKPHSIPMIPSAAVLLALLAAAGCGGADDGSSDASDTGTDTFTDADTGTDEAVTEPPADPAVDTLPDPADVPPDTVQDEEEHDTEADGDASDLPGDPWPDGSTITIDEVRERLEAGDPDMLLLNVSDEEFYDLGHLPGSLVIPWDLLPDHLDLVDPARHIVIYCRRGVRSESALATLQAASYPYAWIMEGGLEAWIAAGNTTVTCDDPSVTCPLL
jgi:rhodanese-related sulfurtransferase